MGGRNLAYLGSRAQKEDGLRVGVARLNAQAGDHQQANRCPSATLVSFQSASTLFQRTIRSASKAVLRFSLGPPPDAWAGSRCCQSGVESFRVYRNVANTVHPGVVSCCLKQLSGLLGEPFFFQLPAYRVPRIKRIGIEGVVKKP